MKRALIFALLVLLSHHSFGQAKLPADDGRIIKIPVVFHVIYSNEAENVSDDLIAKELVDLNRDFTGRNNMSVLDIDFKDAVGNPNIEFYLLDTVFQKSGLKGVHRVASNSNVDTNSMLINETYCVNIFIADQGNGSDILSDRVNLYYKDVGTYYHVLSHEIGHWLGLYHVWGKIGNNNPIKLLVGRHDDEVDDTPTQWKGTDLDYNPQCPPDNIYYRGHKIMYNNFMDYNACRCMFSAGQTIKMRNNIIEHKPLLFSGK